ncbi:MAG: BrnT family toxin [Acidobacteriota bacterium]|nr:BrnT family toxin [Acidobacteriota bacterium]
MKFTWNRSKAESNLEKHGISFAEARTVFYDPWQESFPDPDHSIGEERFICLGMSEQGRVLFVSYTEKTVNYFRLISAREATKSEERKYYEGRSYYS